MSKKSILLIHGFAGGEWDYLPLKRYLESKKHSVEFFDFYYDKRFGHESLTEIADDLHAYIEKNLNGVSFSTVGFSQGGLIFRTLALRYPQYIENCESVVTICTPHHGTLWANFGFGKGVADLRPKSALLTALNNHDDGIPYYAIYNRLDEIVVPGTSALFERARENKEISRFSHYLTFGDSRTLLFAESVFFPTAGA